MSPVLKTVGVSKIQNDCFTVLQDVLKGGKVMVFNTTFNDISVISWLSVLLVEETWVPGENHWLAESDKTWIDIIRRL